LWGLGLRLLGHGDGRLGSSSPDRILQTRRGA
jgi:hypothetical protein